MIVRLSDIVSDSLLLKFKKSFVVINQQIDELFKPFEETL